MAQLETFRPRGGNTYTIGAGAASTVFTIPNGAREVVVNASLNHGRVLVDDVNTPVTPNATNMGYLVANVPLTIKIRQGRDAYLHLSSTIASNIITVTWGN
jgi:hypothetical protein